MEDMKELFSVIIKIAFRLAFAYGLCLLFTVEFNPLLWSTTAKVWLVILVFLLFGS